MALAVKRWRRGPYPLPHSSNLEAYCLKGFRVFLAFQETLAILKSPSDY
jgi:hypothetical protein